MISTTWFGRCTTTASVGGCLRGAVLALAVAWLASDSTALSAAAEPAPRPNIVLIMADDMGFSDLGCYGGEIETPHLDRMAAEGMRFTQFYNNAKCTTTRASLLTGLYPRGAGNQVRQDMVTLGEVLQMAGYRTALSGKWHLGKKAPHRAIDRGFERFYGLLDGCCNFFNPLQPDPEYKGGRVRILAREQEPITNFPDDFYMTDAISDYAAERIGEFAAEGKPFFVHVCYTAPHYPLHALPEDIARYEGKYAIGWDELRRQRHQRQIELGLIDPNWSLPTSDPGTHPWGEEGLQEYQAQLMAVYAAMVDRMDQGIGKILAQLQASGVADNTLVLFLSDNGGCAETPGGIDPSRTPGVKEYYTACGPGWAVAQCTPFRRYKAWVYEGGIATPLIARWPGKVPAGAITHQVGHIIDIMPTCCELAGVEYPRQYQSRTILPCEGSSLASVLRGSQRREPETLCWEWGGNRAIRQGRWKLCWESRGRSGRKWELYDMQTDRTEMHDLAAQHPELVAAMSEAWFDWARRTERNIK